MYRLHILALVWALVLDLFVGNPQWFPRPDKIINSIIDFVSSKFLGQNVYAISSDDKRSRGRILVATVSTIVAVGTAIVVLLGYRIGRVVGLIVEILLTKSCLDTHNLYDESNRLIRVDAEGAIRRIFSNMSNNVVTPIVYLFIGGPVLGLLYKSVVNMNDMLDTNDTRYSEFVKCVEITRNVVEYIPIKLTGALIAVAEAIAPFDLTLDEDKPCTPYDVKRMQLLMWSVWEILFLIILFIYIA